MIFLLGGNGFIGSAFARHLDCRGLPVTVIDRKNYHEMIGEECDVLINANGNSKKLLAKDDPLGDFTASVVSVRASLVDFQFKKYVFLSTSDVYPDCSKPELTREDSTLRANEQSPYGFHKYVAELCVQHSASDWLIVRQGGFVGQGLRKNAVFDVLHGDRLWVHPDSRFQFIDTNDSARLTMELIDRNISNQVLNLTGTGTISVAEIMWLAGRSVGHDKEAKLVSYEISTDKVSQYLSLPRTFESVREFLARGIG
jgi:nucleoside-diphosphate-sugar epimerase